MTLILIDQFFAKLYSYLIQIAFMTNAYCFLYFFNCFFFFFAKLNFKFDYLLKNNYSTYDNTQSRSPNRTSMYKSTDKSLCYEILQLFG